MVSIKEVCNFAKDYVPIAISNDNPVRGSRYIFDLPPFLRNHIFSVESRRGSEVLDGVDDIDISFSAPGICTFRDFVQGFFVGEGINITRLLPVSTLSFPFKIREGRPRTHPKCFSLFSPQLWLWDCGSVRHPLSEVPSSRLKNLE